MHDGHEGEQVSIGLTLEQLGNLDKTTQKLGPLHGVSASDDDQSDSLRERQVSARGIERVVCWISVRAKYQSVTNNNIMCGHNS